MALQSHSTDVPIDGCPRLHSTQGVSTPLPAFASSRATEPTTRTISSPCAFRSFSPAIAQLLEVGGDSGVEFSGFGLLVAHHAGLSFLCHGCPSLGSSKSRWYGSNWKITRRVDFHINSPSRCRKASCVITTRWVRRIICARCYWITARRYFTCAAHNSVPFSGLSQSAPLSPPCS